MRAPSSLGALVASGFISRSLAQAPDYQNPNNNPSQVSAAGLPNSGSEEPSCARAKTTTVFVTVPETGHSSSPGDASDGNQPGGDHSGNSPSTGASPVLTITKTLNPTKTVFVSDGIPDAATDDASDGSSEGSPWEPVPTSGSPSESSGPFVSDGRPENASDQSEGSPDQTNPASGSHPAKSGPFLSDSPPSTATGGDGSENGSSKPFTTLTIDIWGSSDENSGEANPGASTGAQPTDPATATGGSSGGASGLSQAPATSSNPEQQGNGSAPSSDGNGSGNGSFSGPPSYGSVTHPGSNGNDGLPATTGGNAQTSGVGSPRYTVVTDTDVYWTTGPDGPSQTTILSAHTLTLQGNQGGEPTSYAPDQNAPSTSTVIGPDGLPTIVTNPSGQPSANAQGTPGTSTIIGPDGLPTVVISPSSEPSGNSQGAPSPPAVPSAGSSPSGSPITSSSDNGGSNGAPEGQNSGLGSGTCTTFTITGVDGNPTILTISEGESPATGAPSGPISTQTSNNGNPAATGPGSFPTAGFPDTNDHGVLTTSFAITTTGANGLSTVIDATAVITPGNPATEASEDLTTGLPNGSGIPGVSPQVPVLTTCLTLTFTGSDGLPTVTESTVVASAPAGPAGGPTASPSSVSTAGGGSPGIIPFTYTGSDGLPATTQVTVSGFPQGGQTGAPSGISPGWPNSVPGGLGGIPFTYTGSDGLPTVTQLTIPGSSPATPTAASGSLPSGVSAISGASPGVIPFTFTGADGLPTSTQFTVPGSLPTGSAESITGLPSGFPTATGPSPGVIPFTFTGADGIPTVTQLTVPISSFPGATAATAGLPTGAPSVSVGIPGSPNGQGLTTCFTYTVTGTDGLPTVLESTTVLGPVGTATGASAFIPTGTPLGPGASAGSPEQQGVVTCFNYTVTGPGGLPTVIETTVVLNPTGGLSGGFGGPGPVITQGSIAGLPSVLSGPLPTGIPATPGPIPGADDSITTCTSFTSIGPDGLPTVVETTWTAAAPILTQGSVTPGFPSAPISSNGLPWPLTPPTGPVVTSGLPSGLSGGDKTTCTSYTALGPDGRPSIVETTWVIPGSLSTQAPLPFPSGGVLSGLPGQPGGPVSPGPNGPGAGQPPTTCTTFTVLGSDGLPTVVDTTWTVPAGVPTASQSGLGLPTALPPVTGLPSGIVPTPYGSDAITTSVTVLSIGPDGLPTPVIETIVLPSGSQATTAGLPQPASAASVIGGDLPGQPTLSEYGEDISGLPTILPPSGLPVPSDLVQGPAAGSFPSTPLGGPAATGALGGGPPSYGDSLGDGFPLPGQVSPYDASSNQLPTETTLWPTSGAYGSSGAQSPATPCTRTLLRTSTWTEVLSGQTTTYTFKYPFTTLFTVTTPHVSPGIGGLKRRQAVSSDSSIVWTNTSTPAISPANTSPVATPATPLIPSSGTPSVTTPSLSSPTICTAGGKVGNTTLDFDTLEPGPLYNPVDDLWFSQGFSVVPPSSQPGSFQPTSGGQLIVYVPPSAGGIGSADTAEIGVGLNFAKPCFRFNLYGANLGCATEGNEQWCEFEISAYTFNEATGAVEPVPWSETKRVPACANFPSGDCALTPVELDGYTDITSVLITVRVGLELRAWWADDIHVGWTDNGCDAARCRAGSGLPVAKHQASGFGFRRRFRGMIPALL